MTLLGWGERVGHYFRVQHQVVDTIVKPLRIMCVITIATCMHAQ